MRSDLIKRLREKTSAFFSAAYCAALRGKADRQQQQALSSYVALAQGEKHEAADALEEAQRVQEIAIRTLGHISATCFAGHVKRAGDHARKALAEIGHDNVERIVETRP